MNYRRKTNPKIAGEEVRATVCDLVQWQIIWVTQQFQEQTLRLQGLPVLLQLSQSSLGFTPEYQETKALLRATVNTEQPTHVL